MKETAIYVHLSGRDVNNAPQDARDSHKLYKRCSNKSKTMHTMQYYEFPNYQVLLQACGLALDIKAALEIEEKSSEVTMDFMQAVKSDPKIVDFMKMLLQSVSTKV